MPSRPLDPDVALGVKISATCSRNRFEKDLAHVLDELAELAGERTDILAMEAGTYYAGFHENDQHQQAIVAALKTIPGAEAWVEVGRERASRRSPTTP